MNPAPVILMLVVFGLMWLLVLRPQQQRVKAHAALVAGIRVGDEIVTTAGLYGTLVEVDEETVVLDVGHGVRLKMARGAVGARADEAEPESRPQGPHPGVGADDQP